ncbi:hypothetical protein KFK09_025361 [Dendrobium nobile]|uniref:RING-type domain-containing protein n=1 Tax=Dendrobium nobile TaxID=94219 RepID=A0A8T3AGR1_DENNO|nr:hypothetical protein KFK09_025361 [Dendrobium nobile]
MERRRAMTWPRVGKSAQAVLAHGMLFCFTLFLALKIDHRIGYSWWMIFSPLWIFHAVVARGRFSLPAPALPHDRQWAPCHTIVAIPLLVAFELLLCTYLSLRGPEPAAMSLKIVFLPLLAFEVIILLDNFRIAECFAFLVCTKWSNPLIHGRGYFPETSSSSSTIRYRDWNSGLMFSSMEDQEQDRLCGLQDVGGHIMKIPIVAFQILLCMKLEGTPPSTKEMPILALFSPLFLLQGAGVLFAISKLVEKLVLLFRSGSLNGRYFTVSSRAQDCFAFLHHGSRYNTFQGYPPEVVKKMPKKDLAEEVWRLQAALGEQSEITKYSQQEYERLQNEKVLCRICFEAEICMVLLPCRHRTSCKPCAEKCKKCPICRVAIEERMPVYDV